MNIQQKIYVVCLFLKVKRMSSEFIERTSHPNPSRCVAHKKNPINCMSFFNHFHMLCIHKMQNAFAFAAEHWIAQNAMIFVSWTNCYTNCSDSMTRTRPMNEKMAIKFKNLLSSEMGVLHTFWRPLSPHTSSPDFRIRLCLCTPLMASTSISNFTAR